MDATTTLPGKEACPGWLAWSAFGANYPDTACSTILTWEDPRDHPGNGYLCDADDDLRCKDVPCPFCRPQMFMEYQFSEATPLWAADETPVAEGTEIHFHDAPALWWTATHPERGEERVLMREIEDDDVRHPQGQEEEHE